MPRVTQALTLEELFDAEFLSALGAFQILVRRVVRGGRHAEHISRDKGAGIEFADYKPYVPGDDLRSVDWNIYRRLGRIFVKQFEERENLPLYLLIDRSRSMFHEQPPRMVAALRTGLALAAIGLGQHDSVGLYSCSDDLGVSVRSMSGGGRLMTFARHLAALDEQGDTHLAQAVRQLGHLSMREGVLIVISDFFDPAGIDEVVEALKTCRHRLQLVQLTKRADADPGAIEGFNGDLRLLDCESNAAVDVTITPALLTRYRQIYDEFTEALTRFAGNQGAGLVRIDTDGDLIAQLGHLFEAGSLRL